MESMSIKAVTTAITTIAIGVLSIAGCGGSTGKADAVVAQVGSSTITEPTLLHWMATFIRGDYYATTGHKAPDGLAADPPNYSSCASAAATLAPSPASKKHRLTTQELQHACHVLYQDVRAEALSYLISVLWAVGEARELGTTVSDREVQLKLNVLAKQQYSTRQAFTTYLANKGWSLADIHYIYKRNLLSQKLITDARSKASKLGGGQQAFVNVVVRRNVKWTTKTKCRAGDLVWQCQGYRPKASSGPSPAVLFEEMEGR
jgi:hypothetical protein